jgi:two-component system, LytTR family, response regulator AlgR
MKSLNVMIVDDEALARSRLKTLLSDCTEPLATCTAEAQDAMQAMSKLAIQQPDVMLLDIHMPGADGLQLARELRQMRPDMAIVFVTAHPEHAVDAFDLDVTDYLTKPVRLERLQTALRKVATKLLLNTEQTSEQNQRRVPNSSQQTIVISDRGRTERVLLSEVLYFKAELKYVTVRTAQRSYILDGSLSELETQFTDDFLRIHRNTLVAKREMRALERFVGKADDEEDAGVEGWALRLRNCEEPLQVSRRQLATVRAVISQH